MSSAELSSMTDQVHHRDAEARRKSARAKAPSRKEGAKKRVAPTATSTRREFLLNVGEALMKDGITKAVNGLEED